MACIVPSNDMEGDDHGIPTRLGVVLGGFFALAISGGIGFYSLAVMVETILSDMGWSLTRPFVGKWIDRVGVSAVLV